MIEKINFKLNGEPVELTLDINRLLIWVLRTDLELTGTKYGCGINYCGACTVLVDNEAVPSCQTTVKEISNKNVVTIEGLSKKDKLSPRQ